MRTPRTPPPAPDDDEDAAELFRSAIGPVRRIEAPEALPRRTPAPEPRQREADEQAALRQMREAPFRIESPDLLLYRRPEVAPRVLKRLRRGLYVVQDELDLHRMHAAEAEQALRRFLSEVRRAGFGCVRLIHGKGLHSDSTAGPVLKPLVERMLAQRNDVLAYATAPPAQGGGGAVLVLLARSDRGPVLSAAGDRDAAG